MKPDYKNWMPDWMIRGFVSATAGLGAATALLYETGKNKNSSRLKTAAILTGGAAAVTGRVAAWTVYSHHMYSYDGKRKLSKQIIEGTASYITLPEGGIGLDIGCGSGALTIACARRNPDATMIGLDRWGNDYPAFSKRLCEDNAEAEGVNNVLFQQGDAMHLDFADEVFDAVTSNYVYHDLPVRNGKDRQALILETLRVLKKGGCFAIHDLFSKHNYGDMDEFVQHLKDMGYEDVRLIDTTNGTFMSRREAALLWCSGAALLVGKK